MRTKILFIINPVSGIGRQKNIEEIIHSELDLNKWSVDIAYTKYKGHALELSLAAAGNYAIVVAVGGDGTVNETGRGLINSSTALGIIPTGSGNGLARHLEIPFKINKALEVISQAKLKAIDVIKINDYYSLNVAGIGFDAYISHQFANRKNRGPLAYMQLITKEFMTYKSSVYRVTIGDQTRDWDAFLISFANSSQYGNNVYIAPQARIDDGLIDVCLIRDFPKFTAPALLISMLDQSIDRNRYDLIVKSPKVIVEHTSDLLGHVDGEPVNLGKKAEVEIMHLALKVVAPDIHLRQIQNLFSPIREMLPVINRN
ncbi:diacylglycerol/lipid kinase family protein [Geofilum sp. OHC36d9]|uniref:diacylglycerol/lipid kinase family protein n=1 Tax=Geofilum sp. OHC36d9 TaxID=3458413 RepID=UPI004034AA75